MGGFFGFPQAGDQDSLTDLESTTGSAASNSLDNEVSEQLEQKFSPGADTSAIASGSQIISGTVQRNSYHNRRGS